MTGPKGGLGERERQNSACHFRVKREGGECVGGGRREVEGGGGEGSGGSPFLMLKVIRLLLACPRGVFYLESGLGLNKF